CFFRKNRRGDNYPDTGGPVDNDLYQYLSPLGWEHVNLTGDYVWRQSRKLEDGKFRPLRELGKP
ncbi:Tn3 family transposase, partial [Pseudomonas syringae]